MMGSPPRQGYDDERPQHQVSVAAFLMGRGLVTQAQWQAVMGEPLRCRCPGPELPAHNVSWGEAQRFCERLAALTGRAYRLPTEAEWEYACRAGSTTAFNTGPTISTDQANYNGQFVYGAGAKGVYRHVPTEAGTFPPNEFGLYDMHGNLWEWCADAWHDDYQGAPADGRAWEAGKAPRYRVTRGGSWHDTPDVCRSAVRLKTLAREGDDLIGFRVAVTGGL
jgi:formylglycine-generating enzyme required for sulfatase activity